ncbi:hypothetical protein V9T40_014359 [Parthenolecanium corni]|uniref:Uncharacterized protein n=1 Tax=Parthenolecanium corni TaxID=536013 RepID=A0AAN9XWY4_9HEMI
MTANRSTLPIVSDFEPSKLANLTSQEEHKLQLRALLDKELTIKYKILMLELFARKSGNELYGFIDDENANRKCTAIIKAFFECLGKLKVQNHTKDVYLDVIALPTSSFFSEPTGDDLGKNLSLICSVMNEQLKNEAVYKALLDENEKSESWYRRKILLYSIPKSKNELQKALAEVYNAPQTKTYKAHLGFIFSDSSIKLTISNLIKVPGKLEMVQKIYDQVIQELVSQTEDIAVDEIDIIERGILDLQQNVSYITLFRKLKEKINANPDLKSSITTTGKTLRRGALTLVIGVVCIICILMNS